MLRKLFLVTGGLVLLAATAVVGMSADFCFGWNVEKCDQPSRSEISLMKVGPIDVTCEGCYFQTKGTVEFDLEPLEKKLRIGVENMELDFVGMIDATASGQWSFQKSESPTIFKGTIINDHVGFIPIHIWFEIPLEIDLRGGLNGNVDGKIGVSVRAIIGSWETIYDHGGWKHINPNPHLEITHQLDSSMHAEGTVDLTIQPEINIHVDDIFEGGLTVNQDSSLDVSLGGKALGTTDMECGVCTWLVGEAEQFLASNVSLEKMETLLDDLCSKFGDSISPLCKSLVEEYLPTILEFVESKLTPQLICQKISLCPHGNGLEPYSETRVKTAEKHDPEECVVCQFLLHGVEKLISANYTLDVIETLMDEACSKLGPLSGLCKEGVSSYLPKIISYLEAEVNPSEICQKLGLCSSSLSGLMENDANVCAHITETLEVDWKGELKLDWFHYDKNFDRKLVDVSKDFHFGVCETVV